MGEGYSDTKIRKLEREALEFADELLKKSAGCCRLMPFNGVYAYVYVATGLESGIM